MVNKHIEELLRRVLSADVVVSNIIPVGGGSISNAYRLETSLGSYFLKTDGRADASSMFRAEGEGLNLLRLNSKFTIPEFVGLVTEGPTAMLLMELINSSGRSNTYWKDLGYWLADLHRTSNSRFGLESNNYIGSLPQYNDFEPTWYDFFINMRITPQVKMARDHGLISSSFNSEIGRALPKIVDLMPIEPPALIHGDLWSGNLMVDDKGSPCLVDPAVYYGHREMDIAFSRLFGGFSSEFYESYNEAYPMEPGIESRIDLYNLYPLLVHLNLFGMSYYGQIASTISRFT